MELFRFHIPKTFSFHKIRSVDPFENLSENMIKKSTLTEYKCKILVLAFIIIEKDRKNRRKNGNNSKGKNQKIQKDEKSQTKNPDQVDQTQEYQEEEKEKQSCADKSTKLYSKHTIRFYRQRTGIL